MKCGRAAAPSIRCHEPTFCCQTDLTRYCIINLRAVAEIRQILSHCSHELSKTTYQATDHVGYRDITNSPCTDFEEAWKMRKREGATEKKKELHTEEQHSSTVHRTY